jgi:UDP-glucose 4-epimerase
MKPLQRDRVIVSGGAGFIGSRIASRLAALGAQVLVVDDLSAGSREAVPAGAELEEVDVTTREAVRLVHAWRPTAFVHSAAQVSVAASWLDPAHDARANIVGTVAMVHACAAMPSCRRFLYITTGGALYGEAHASPVKEDGRVAPLSPYGLSKWTAEQYVSMLTGDTGWFVLRLANVYGPGQRSDGEGGVVSVFIERMLRGETVEIHGDGEQTRDFVFVEDTAGAVVAALAAEASGIANIGTGISTSINQLFAKLAPLTAYGMAPVSAPNRRGDIRHSVLDPSAAERLLGWHPQTTLQDGLAATLREIRMRAEA